jgi:putative membrane protein insertion efficiency factor
MRGLRRRVLWSVLAAATVVLVFDGRRPPARQLTNRILIGVIEGYRATLSPVFEIAGVKCRFTPSCSVYAIAALDRLGVVRGSWWTVRRLGRCGPWTQMGTIDPPPGQRVCVPPETGLSSASRSR